MKNLKSILVGIDFSKPSDNAVVEAERIALWNGAKLTAVRILDEAILERVGEHAPEIQNT
jgi:nucleotide-binding universal stress UspA family protein